MKKCRQVPEILKNPVDRQYVILKGRITKKVSRDSYEFVDAPGNMKVTIDEKHFFDKKVSDKIKVELYGEVEKDFMKPLIAEVERLTILARE